MSCNQNFKGLYELFWFIEQDLIGVQVLFTYSHHVKHYFPYITDTVTAIFEHVPYIKLYSEVHFQPLWSSCSDS